ncbi:MAG: hypothetical protein H7256_04925 [Bdellovibrio sp.]|nr:hypothetical protein [Bdellovibrio sp.]
MNALILVLFIFLSACNYKSTKSGALILTPTTQSINSFDLIKANIIDTSCLRCHNGASAKAGVDLSSYASMMANSELITAGNAPTSLFFTEVESGSMPLGAPALTANEVKSIQDWINSGAPNGEFNPNPTTPSIPVITPPAAPTPEPAPLPVPTPAPTPATSAPVASYTDVQTKIFNQSCLRCHSGEFPAANVNLTNYELVMANNDPKAIEPGKSADSFIYTEIQSGRMPPRGAKVSPELIEVLKNWIDQGAANN